MSNKLNYNLFYLSLSVLIVLSFFVGFYLNEDAAGGGKVDLYAHEWGNIQLFKDSNLLFALTDLQYESSRTPLYLIINKFNPFTETIEEFRISYIFFAITIPILFFIFLVKNFKTTNINVLIFLSCVLMVSPYFRTMAFWADTEGLAIFFLLSTFISLNSLLELSYINNKKKYYLFATFTALLSFLSFYTDQKYVFLSIFVYFILAFKNDFKFFFIFSLICFTFSIPALYLFYIWEGLVPIESQFRLTFSPHGLNIFLSSIGIYLLPIFIVLLLEKKIKFFFLNFKLFELIIFLIISLILFLTLPDNPKFDGVGVVFKFLSLISNKFNINWNLILYIYYLGNLFFLLLILIFFKKNFRNYLFLVIYSIIFVMVSSTYQQYVDPIFFLLIFCYFNFVDKIKISDIKYVSVYFLFYFLLLFGSIFYRSVCSIYFLKAACGV